MKKIILFFLLFVSFTICQPYQTFNWTSPKFGYQESSLGFWLYRPSANILKIYNYAGTDSLRVHAARLYCDQVIATGTIGTVDWMTVTNGTAGFRTNGDFQLQATGGMLMTSSADGSDNKYIRITSAGGYGSTRGAGIDIGGNEYTSRPGRLTLLSGSTGYVKMDTDTLMLFGLKIVSFDTTTFSDTLAISFGNGRIAKMPLYDE